jgi:hypothetical protein
MAATIGVTSLLSLISAPTGCVINEVTKEQTKEIKTIRNATGTTVQAGTVNMTETKVTVKGKGMPNLSLVSTATIIASATLKVVSASIDETLDDFPDFTLEAVSWS